jgi:N-acetylmuramoyl-L-alanine amidase
VELDYISNPKREKMLRSPSHQKKLAHALFNGSVDFFKKMGRLSSNMSDGAPQYASNP